ncbi:MAG TPA: Asp-tRNA(Asn)/Glu-tRNA(Gln) amidotransferase subunit GatB [Acidimicrobiia bacterium]|nr:Asp-tRNA(Asn)/Glu-tRNA(Gln) amidotransferase subunit GatB [Acidimicrobiia bacterium]
MTITISQDTKFEAVIGLEVHVELSTATKLFCGCANDFGSEPNTNVCPVCMALPGALPVLNERVVEFALRIGEALEFDVPNQSVFHRKNYFYPDMPKNFQTSQFDQPICMDGKLEIETSQGTKVIRIERAHMEEDTGKSTHVGESGRLHGADYSLVDYNRAGVPLMEIVSRPDISSSEEARAYVGELRAVLKAIDVSDVKMEEGSMRVDANVSVRPVGQQELGTRAEIKNMNSLRSLGRAVDYEISRQVARVKSGEKIVQETRHWNENEGKTSSMRSKEEANDYRYFPEPDLVPVVPTDVMREMVHAGMPELPAQKRNRIIEDWKISESDARTLVSNPELYDFVEGAVSLSSVKIAKDATNFATIEVAGELNEKGLDISVAPITSENLAEVCELVSNGDLSRNQAKTLLGYLVDRGGVVSSVVGELGLKQVSDEGALEQIVDSILSQFPEDVAQWPDADEAKRKKLQGFFMGKCMAQSKGQGNPQIFNSMIESKLAK